MSRILIPAPVSWNTIRKYYSLTRAQKLTKQKEECFLRIAGCRARKAVTTSFDPTVVTGSDW